MLKVSNKFNEPACKGKRSRTHRNGTQAIVKLSVLYVIRKFGICNKFIQEGFDTQQFSNNITVSPFHTHDEGNGSKNIGANVL